MIILKIKNDNYMSSQKNEELISFLVQKKENVFYGLISDPESNEKLKIKGTYEKNMGMELHTFVDDFFSSSYIKFDKEKKVFIGNWIHPYSKNKYSIIAQFKGLIDQKTEELTDSIINANFYEFKIENAKNKAK